MSQTLKFLVSNVKGDKATNDKSCYFKKDGVLIFINCGRGVLDAVKKSILLKDVKEVYQILTHDSNDHIFDIKDFFEYVKTETGKKPILIDSISYKRNKLAKAGLKEDRDYESVNPLKNNFNWINFLAFPHSDKSLSCPIELVLNDKKIFYAGDCNNIPFSIEGYDEYYFDFADKESEYFMNIEGIKKVVKKNKIRKDKLWVVHLISLKAFEMAQRAGMQIATEEKLKFRKVKRTLTKNVELSPQFKK
ncbi:MAG: hypothetical protein PHI76_02540 [Clostridia bacterium]|nr:hypothetical protein [Clostridia bacterium]